MAQQIRIDRDRPHVGPSGYTYRTVSLREGKRANVVYRSSKSGYDRAEGAMRGATLKLDHLSPSSSSSSSSTNTADERFYLRRMKEILEEVPNKRPPPYPVQLCGHVYIGSQRDADDLDDLKRLGITHVLNMAGTRNFDLTRSPYPARSGIEGYLLIPAEDHDQYDIMQHFSKTTSFLDKVKKSGGKALVHCNLGVNRSGAICAAYLIIHERMNLLEVCSLLKKKRQFVLCNKHFRRQLLRFARARGYLDEVIDTGNDRSSSGRADSDSGRNRKDKSQRNNQQSHIADRVSRSLTESPNSHRLSSVTSTYNSTVHKHGSNGEKKDPKLDYSSYCTMPRRNAGSSYLASHETHYQPPPAEDPHMDAVPEDSTLGSFKSRWFRSPKPFSSRRGTATSSGASPVEDESLGQSPSSASSSSSPRVSSGGFLSRFSRKSLTNVSRISQEDEQQQQQPAKSESRRDNGNGGDGDGRSRSGDGVSGSSDESTSSTCRPLRVYKRAATDTELYRRPAHPAHTYRRAETIASTDPTDYQRQRANADLRDDPLLPQEALYHTARTTQPTPPAAGTSSNTNTPGSTRILGRLRPAYHKTNSLNF